MSQPACLEERVPGKNQCRFHRLLPVPTLFGASSLIGEWRRIGQLAKKEEASVALTSKAREKQRRGCR